MASVCQDHHCHFSTTDCSFLPHNEGILYTHLENNNIVVLTYSCISWTVVLLCVV